MFPILTLVLCTLDNIGNALGTHHIHVHVFSISNYSYAVYITYIHLCHLNTLHQRPTWDHIGYKLLLVTLV